MVDGILYSLDLLRVEMIQHNGTMARYFPHQHSYHLPQHASLEHAGHALANGRTGEARKILEQIKLGLEHRSFPASFVMPRVFAAQIGGLIERIRDLDSADSHPLDLDA